MINAKETGRFIAECRRKKGMTQQELGDRLHVTNRAVSKWENGKSFPDVGLLEDLGRELDVSVGDLLAGKRIEAEHYQKETEKMLVEALGNRRLYGYEIVTYIMTVLAVFAFWIPLPDHRKRRVSEAHVAASQRGQRVVLDYLCGAHRMYPLSGQSASGKGIEGNQRETFRRNGCRCRAAQFSVPVSERRGTGQRWKAAGNLGLGVDCGGASHHAAAGSRCLVLRGG